MDVLFWIGIFMAGCVAGLILKSVFSSGLKSELKVTQQQLAAYQQSHQQLETRLNDAHQKEIELQRELAISQEQRDALGQRLAAEKQELEERQSQLRRDFELMAQKIFEEKSKRFSEQNQTQLQELLKPLGERLAGFQKKVEETNEADIQRSTALEMQLKQLKELNQQITKEAHSLTQALRGDSKTQGQWGELQLSGILEMAGLEEGVHFHREQSHQAENGKRQRLDFVIKLPGQRHLILDAKVSLSAYSRYFEADDEQQKNKYLQEHLTSLNGHIKSLSERNYQQLHSINPPDYVLMFVANEPALTIALQEDPKLYEKALSRNIALVSSTTLLATLRTVSFIWQQDSRQKNAEEIARQAGGLYDKFVLFTEALQEVGSHLEKTQVSYDKAMNRLKDGKANLIKRTEELRKLGAANSRTQDSNLLDD